MEEVQATREDGTVLCKVLHKFGLLPQIVNRACVSGVSSVSHDNAHLCGSFDSHTSLSESGCTFCVP